MNTRLTTTSATEDPAADDLTPHREAIATLGRELRLLVDTAVRTTASPETLHRLAADTRALTQQLTGRLRSPSEIPEVDEFPGGVRMFSPVTGIGSPIAPPMHVTRTEDTLVGRCSLGIPHEGPPGYVHGGVSAMLLDELMGWACTATGKPGHDHLAPHAIPGPGPPTGPSTRNRPRHGNRRTQDLRDRIDRHGTGREHPSGGGRRRLPRPNPRGRPRPLSSLRQRRVSHSPTRR